MALAAVAVLAALVAVAAARCDEAQSPDLPGLKEAAWAWYRDGAMSVEDTERWSHMLANRTSLVEVCAPGVLQGLVLKIEETVLDGPQERAALTGAYVQALQIAVVRGYLEPQELVLWPITKGWERAEHQRLLLGTPRSGTSAMVLNYCTSADRFGQAHDLAWLLEPPFGDPTQVQPTEEVEHVGLLRRTDLYIYIVDAPKCTGLNETFVEKLRGAVRSVHLERYRGGPAREEQSAYFKFLVDHYDDLPDFTIFVHPDAPEHQGEEFEALSAALQLIHTESELAHRSLQYYPLSLQMVVEPMRTWGVGFFDDWIEFWDRLFDRPWETYGFEPPRCLWRQHTGFFIRGLLPGAPEQLSSEKAKELCESREDCVGITCGTPIEFEEEPLTGDHPNRSGTCSARTGALRESPFGIEFSHMKNCSDAHAEAVYAAAQAPAPAAEYVPHLDMYLPGYAADDELERPQRAAQAQCDWLGPACMGYTCDASGRACTVRGGEVLEPSPVGEMTFVKVGSSSVGTAAVLRDGDLRRPAPARGAGKFQGYTGSQSVVHRDRILAWSREELAALAADVDWLERHTGMYEMVWHAMFGEPLSQPTRQDDPRIPMRLKWAAPTKYSWGDEYIV